MASKAAARRYAKALMEVAVEDKAAKRYGDDLKAAVAAFKENPRLYSVLLNPMYKQDERAALIDAVSSALKLSKAVKSLLGILVAGRAIKLLDAVGERYSALEDELAGRLRATVETPVELKGKALDEIADKLGQATGKEVVVEAVVNPAVIGGLVIRIGNTVIDSSLRTQLKLIRDNILEGVA